ncbi:hypothetical protein JOD27_005719 [Lentzea nigeriaca]|uniref:HEPN domain-containing protein n=1 Tax=Lentzea nigeriaca TaxID=1128665 RepID=UPI001959C12F|nr:HEPN domain-containing protein [Lentzea nigeriaca]MBM7861890.1 hypothetical protein [Lentzea nigeriaca]
MTADSAKLREDISHLAAVLVPTVPVDEVPSPEESLKIRAFIVLAHSAIEEAIEDRMHSAVKEALKCAGGTVPTIAVPLAVKYSPDLIGQNGGKVPDFDGCIAKLAPLYFTNVIKANNGIRRQNIDKMLKPLGYDSTALGEGVEDALSALDTLGAKRGASAHTLVVAAEEVIHPSQATEWVNQALDGADLVVDAILKKISEGVVDAA